MRLGVKLISSYLFVVALVVAVGIISGSYNRSVNESLKAENQVATQTVEYAFNIERNLYVTLRLLHELTHNYQSESIVVPSLERRGIGAIRSDIEEQFDEMYLNYINLRNITLSAERVDSSDVIFFEDLQDKLIAYQGYANVIQDELESGSVEAAEQVYNITLVPYFDNNILRSLISLRELARQEQALMVEQLDDSRVKMQQVTVWATFIAFVIALIIVVVINASIVKPMNKITEASKKLGEGDMDTRIDLDRNDEVGQLAGSFNDMVENLKKRTISRDFLDNVIESMEESLFIVNEEDKVERVNQSGCKLLDYELEELIGKHIEDIQLSEPDEKKGIETKLRKSSGQQVDVSVSSSVLSNPFGSSELRLFVVSDISERVASEEQIKKSLEEKKVLLAEIHHRVKNNLAVISGLLQMQSWKTESEDAKKVLADSQLRVESIALVHEMLYESDSLAYIRYDKYINDLMQAISSMYMDSGMDVELLSEVDGVNLTINQAIPVSLLLNEIIVNSYKHAFPDDGKGRIEVKMWEELSRVYIEVSDDGVGVDLDAMDEDTNSLGLTLIRTLIKQVNGEYNFENLPEGGTKVSVSFEMDF